MVAQKPDKNTLKRYAILQVPGILLALVAATVLLQYTSWPSWLIWAGFSVWVAKDVLLFFWLWPSYTPAERVQDPLVGARGFVSESCSPEGIVEIHGTRWRAVATEEERSLSVGTMIRVKGREGLTLQIESDREEDIMEDLQNEL